MSGWLAAGLWVFTTLECSYDGQCAPLRPSSLSIPHFTRLAHSVDYRRHADTVPSSSYVGMTYCDITCVGCIVEFGETVKSFQVLSEFYYSPIYIFEAFRPYFLIGRAVRC